MNRTLWLSCLIMVIAIGGVKANPPVAPPPRPLPPVELVRRLGSEDYREREEASRQLLRYSVATPELLAARGSPDPEVRLRAQMIVTAITRRVEEKMLARGRTFAATGAVDLFVASTATWDLPPDDWRLWVPGYDLSRQIFNTAKQEYHWPHPLPGHGPLQRKDLYWRGPLQRKDFYDYRRRDLPPAIRTDTVVKYYGLVMAGRVRSKLLAGSLVISRGDVCIGKHGESLESERRCENSVVLANGDVTADTRLIQAVIVCDGNVETKWIRDCLVIARGDITASVLAQGSVLIAGGKVRMAKDGGERLDERNYVVEGADKPLGFVTFFELSRVGLEVKAADGAVRVAAVAAGKPGEKAGVKAGDTILDVNGKKPADAEALRRLLRDALAVGDATVKLQRGNDTLTVKLSLPE